MYVTRPLSRYQDDLDAAAEPPPEDPGSGILVVEDEVAVQRATRWWGLWVDMTNCCFWSFVNDVPPRPFDRGDVYQQVEVVQLPHGRGFTAVAVAPDGIPPGYLRRKGWKVHTSASTSYNLTNAAHGTDWPLRRRMPDLDSFDVGVGGSWPVVVGKWYCPFMFIKDDGEQVKDQAKRCMFYEMTLEQSWEEIYTRDNAYRVRNTSGTTNEVEVSATVRRSTG